MVSPNVEKYDEEDGALVVASGGKARVLLFGEARSEFEKLMQLEDQDSVAACITLKRYFKEYANQGPQGLTKNMLKPEGRHRVNGINVQVQAFRGKHVRIYGVSDEYGGILCFCGTSCDPAKKKQKADREKLKKAAEEWTRIKNGQKQP